MDLFENLISKKKKKKKKESIFKRGLFRAIDSLHDQELCLFEERIRIIFKKLQPAFIGKVTYTDENTFHDFAFEANRIIDQV